MPTSDVVAVVRDRRKGADLAERGVYVREADYMATAQANFLRDLTKAWMSAARKALK